EISRPPRRNDAPAPISSRETPPSHLLHRLPITDHRQRKHDGRKQPHRPERPRDVAQRPPLYQNRPQDLHEVPDRVPLGDGLPRAGHRLDVSETAAEEEERDDDEERDEQRLLPCL